MNVPQIIFLVVIVSVVTIAITIGGTDERIAAVSMLAAAIFSPFLVMSGFSEAEIFIAIVDACLLLILLYLALISDRNWPMFAAGFQLTGTLIHLFPGLLSDLHPDAYADVAVLWAYPVLLSLGVGTLIECRRYHGK